MTLKFFLQNKKIEKIQEIWAADLGVVSLHVFQNTIPVEAWTREAALISALGKLFFKYLCIIVLMFIPVALR